MPNKAVPEPLDIKMLELDKLQSEPAPNSPMDKFNKALRKILSVLKKDINKK
jgi:hypothetical protein